MSIVDYFVPKWKNSDPEVRIKAMERIRKNSIFETIANADPDERVRIAAVQRIVNMEILTVLASEKDLPKVADAAMTRVDTLLKEAFRGAAGRDEKETILSGIYREKSLGELIVEEGELESAELILGRMSDERLIAAVVPNLSVTALRRAAVAKISDEFLLSELTCRNCGKEIGKNIVARLESREALERVAGGASSRKVRKLADEKLGRSGMKPDEPAVEPAVEPAAEPVGESAAESPGETEATSALEQACRKVEGLSRAEDPEEIELEIRRAEEELERFDPHGRHPLGERLSRLRAVAAGKAAALRKQGKLMERLNVFLSAVPKTAVGEDDPCRREVEGLKSEWAALDLSPLEEALKARMNRDFFDLCEKIEEIYERTASEQAALSMGLEKMTDCCVKMESIGGKGGTPEGERRFTEIEREWERHVFSGDEADPLRGRFEAARKLFLENREKIAARMEERADELAALCEVVEAAAAGKGDNRFELEGRVKEARKAWRASGGPEPSVKKELETRFNTAVSSFQEAQAEFREALDWEMWSNLNLKKRIAGELSELSGEADPVRTARKIRELSASWERIGPVSRQDVGEVNDAYRSSFASCCERCMALKRKLHAEVEEIVNVPGISGGNERVRALQEEWKKMGALPLAEDRELGKSFKALCNAYYENRKALFRKQDGERQANLHLKTELCETAEGLSESTEWVVAAEVLKGLQARWKEIGPVPRRSGDELWVRFRGACDRFFGRLEQEKPENLKKKEALVEKLEALTATLDGERDLEKTAPEVMALQKAWKEIGPVPREASESLWKRFREPCDRFFRMRSEHRLNNRTAKEVLAEQAEGLMEETDWKETGEKLMNLQREWKAIGPAPAREEKELWKRFHGACDRFFHRRNRYYTELDRERVENLRIKEKLCASLELLAQIADLAPSKDASVSFPMAEQLRLGMELKDEVTAQGEKETRENAMRKFRKIREAWTRTGPVPRKHEKELRERYGAAERPFRGR